MDRRRNPARVCSRIGLGLFFMMLVWVVLVNVLTALVMQYRPAWLESMWVVWLLNDIPLYLVGMPLFLLVLERVPDGPVTPRYRVPIGPGRYFVILAFCLGATYCINLIMGGLLVLLELLIPGAGGLQDSTLTGIATTGGWLPNLIFGACVPALGEEFLFRYMLRRKMSGCADKTYVFFSGLCFALFHGNVQQMFYAFILGALFAWLYLATNNIWLPVSLHFLVNLIGIVLAPMALKSERLTLLLGMFVVALIPTAIVLFAVYQRRIFAAMRPPTEAGWPHKPGKPLPRLPWQRPRWPEDDSAWVWTQQAGWVLPQPAYAAGAYPPVAQWPGAGVGAAAHYGVGWAPNAAPLPPAAQPWPGQPPAPAPAWPPYGPYPAVPGAPVYSAHQPGYPPAEPPPATAAPPYYGPGISYPAGAPAQPAPLQPAVAPAVAPACPAAEALQAAGTGPAAVQAEKQAEPKAARAPRGGALRGCLRNPGMVLYIILCAVTIALNLIALFAPVDFLV